MIDAGEEYVLVCDAPGARSETLELRPGPLPGTLSIGVALKDTSVSGQMIRAERSGAGAPTRLARVVPVGFDADVARAKGSFENGVLTIRVPRKDHA